jgi:hypothetical protein
MEPLCDHSLKDSARRRAIQRVGQFFFFVLQRRKRPDAGIIFHAVRTQHVIRLLRVRTIPNANNRADRLHLQPPFASAKSLKQRQEKIYCAFRASMFSDPMKFEENAAKIREALL